VTRRTPLAATILALTVCLPALSGCGDGGQGTKYAERSPEAKKADEVGGKAMLEFMKGGGPKKAAKSGRLY
jgi:hypothetical protein